MGKEWQIFAEEIAGTIKENQPEVFTIGKLPRLRHLFQAAHFL